MELYNIPSSGKFGTITRKLNDNFYLLRVAIGDIEYSTRKNKGMFATDTALRAAIPIPAVGDWALVGNSFPADLYVCTTAGTWTDSGEDYEGDNVDFNDYLEKSDFETYREGIDERMSNIEDVNNSATVTPPLNAGWPWTYLYIGEIHIGDEIFWDVTTESTMRWNVGTRIQNDGTWVNVDAISGRYGDNSGSFIAEHNATHLGFRVFEEHVSDTTQFYVSMRIVRAKAMASQSIEEYALKDGAVTTPKIADGAVTANKIANGAMTALKGDYALANWQLMSKIIPDVNTAEGYISFGNADQADVYIASQKGILWLNKKENGEYVHSNLISNGKIACPFKLGTSDTRSSITALFLDTNNYKWVVRDMYCWDRANETIQERNYPTNGLILIGTVETSLTDGEYVAGSYKRGYFPFQYTVNGKSGGINGVKADGADYALANWQLMSPNVPDINTRTGYINFGPASGGGDIYIASQKGILWLNRKVDGNYTHPNLVHDGNIECPFKLGTTDTRSSLIALFLDTNNYKWVVRDIYCWDRANETIWNARPTDGLILLGTVRVNFDNDGYYTSGGFVHGFFPFNFTVDGKTHGGESESKDITDLNSPKEVLNILKNWRYDISNRPNDGGGGRLNQQLTLLHFSDMHISSDANTKANLARVMEFYNNYSTYIDDILHTGDTVADKFADSLDEWDAIDGTENILNVVGNHDANTHLQDKPTLVQIYNKIIAPYVSNWGVTQPSNAASNGRCYWYKDYTDAHVRLIGLDIVLESGQYSSAEQAAQRTWLTNVLSDARTNDYAVVIAEHYPTFIEPLDNCPFFTPPMFSIGNNLANLAPIVQNYIDNGGEFVCWLAGHTHRDIVGTVYSVVNDTRVEYSQLIFCVDTEKLSSAAGWSDSLREFGKKSQDCFNLVSIDRYSKTVTFYRIGCDTNRLGMKKQTLCWDYENCKMLYCK